MSIRFATNSAFNIAGSTKYTVTDAGRVLVPSQPGFNVMSLHATASGSNVVPGGTVQFNIGSCYNNTNGRFTAPVAGVYYVRFQQLAQNGTTGEFRTAIYKNDAGYGGARFITYKNQWMWWTLIADAYVQMAVNDYVTVRYESGGAALYTDSNYATFSGHFVG